MLSLSLCFAHLHLPPIKWGNNIIILSREDREFVRGRTRGFLRTLSLCHSLYFPFSSVNIFGHSSSPLLFSHNPFKVDIFPFSFLLFLISVLLYFLLYVSEMVEQFHNPLQIPSSHSAHKPWQGHIHTHTHKSNKYITNRRHRAFYFFVLGFTMR